MADGALSSFIFIAAALLLLHSSYSAYEFSYFVKHLSTSSLSHTEIPLDVSIFLCLPALNIIFSV